MIRVLFIGRSTPERVRRVRALVSRDILELDQAVLPAEGIRRIDDTPPDLVVVVGPESHARLGNLLEGIRSRPAGGLAPIVLLTDVEPPDDVAAHCDALLGLDIDERELVATFAALLDVPIESVDAAEPPSPQPRPPAPQPLPAQTIEPAVAPSPQRVAVDAVDAAAVEQKWRDVRATSYFAILEVEPSAATDEIRSAIARLRARFAPRNIPAPVASRYAEQLREIRDALDDAAAVLGDPEIREQYTRHHR